MFENTKTNNLGYGIDYLRNKYGKNSIVIASNINKKYLNDEKD